MPCSNTASKAVIILDEYECLLEYDFSKMTCGKKVGGDTGFSQYCYGQSIEKILEIEYEVMAEKMGLEEEGERFLLYLEWAALQSALAQYRGLEEGDRYKIATIDYDINRVEIGLVVYPPTEMPKRIPSCSVIATT